MLILLIPFQFQCLLKKKRKQKQENKLLPFTLNISNPHHFSVDDVTSYFHEITEPISTKYLILAPHPQNPRKVCDQSPFSLENAGRNINLITGRRQGKGGSHLTTQLTWGRLRIMTFFIL